MTDRPEKAASLESDATRADVLSHLLTLVRLRGELVYSAELTGGWNGAFPAGASHLLFVEAGTVWLTPAGDRPVRLDTGDLVLLPHGRGHRISDRPDSDTSAIDLLADAHFNRQTLSVRHGGAGAAVTLIGGLFRFEGLPLPPVIQALPTVIHIPGDGGQIPEWLQLMARFLMIEAREPRPGSALMISRTIDLLVIRALRSWADLRPSEAGWLAGLADARIGRALNAIHSDPGRDWSLGSLSDLAGMSRTTFADRFSAALGDAPMRYLARWRMAIAEQLLRAGGVGVGEAGRRVGYASEAGFSRAFKAHFGRAPAFVRPGPSRI